jgi:hypothetical protein
VAKGTNIQEIRREELEWTRRHGLYTWQVHPSDRYVYSAKYRPGGKSFGVRGNETNRETQEGG